jgi:hypothetical protein
MASKTKTAKTTDRVRNKDTNEVISFHASHRSAMVECGRQWNTGVAATQDSLTADGRWWNAGQGYLSA